MAHKENANSNNKDTIYTKPITCGFNSSWWSLQGFAVDLVTVGQIEAPPEHEFLDLGGTRQLTALCDA